MKTKTAQTNNSTESDGGYCWKMFERVEWEWQNYGAATVLFFCIHNCKLLGGSIKVIRSVNARVPDLEVMKLTPCRSCYTLSIPCEIVIWSSRVDPFLSSSLLSSP